MLPGAGVKSIWEHTLAKVGIPFKGTFAYDAETVADIVSRNPSLNASSFVLLSSTVQEPHPFPVVGTTLLGPYAMYVQHNLVRRIAWPVKYNSLFCV